MTGLSAPFPKVNRTVFYSLITATTRATELMKQEQCKKRKHKEKTASSENLRFIQSFIFDLRNRVNNKLRQLEVTLRFFA